MRVVIDTNVFVSGLMLPASVPGRILTAAYTGGFELVLSEQILDEIGMAVRYPKVRTRIGLTDDELDRNIRALRYVADVVDPSGIVVDVPGDRDDEVILATLVVAKADWLITGDAMLLALSNQYPIVTPAAFAARHL
ncbi:MAG: putative toxin-antitoxin system toxin component, PIN family [Casimicrobiaceae bacterium]